MTIVYFNIFFCIINYVSVQVAQCQCIMYSHLRHKFIIFIMWLKDKLSQAKDFGTTAFALYAI